MKTPGRRLGATGNFRERNGKWEGSLEDGRVNTPSFWKAEMAFPDTLAVDLRNKRLLRKFPSRAQLDRPFVRPSRNQGESIFICRVAGSVLLCGFLACGLRWQL